MLHAVFTSLLLCFLFSSAATSGPLTKDIEVNGVRLAYVEEGSGETIVFIHGAVSDLRTWDVIREEVAKKYRFVAYTQRYFGTGLWQDDGNGFGVATHADDLAKFIAALDAGPVHVVGWSYGGQVAVTAAAQQPSLIRSLILYEASVISVLPTESVEGKAAREERGQTFAPVGAASKSGDHIGAARLLLEAVFRLPPGGFEQEPQALRTMWEENARTVPLTFGAPPPPPITCEVLLNLAKPALIVEGENTLMNYKLINDAFGKCIPGARRVVLKNINHDGPVRDPAAFSATALEFLSSFGRPTQP